MNKQSINKYILLGKVIRALTMHNSFVKEDFILNIEHIYSYCIEAGFKVSVAKLENEFDDFVREIKLLEDGTILDTDKMEYIKNAMIRCEEIFNIEAESKDVYELYHPRLEIEKLIDNTNLILEKYEKLNSLAKDDFDNGCKALAYGLWTASVFHYMRTIENLTYVYAKKFGIEKGEKENMGGIIIKLRNQENIKKNKSKYDSRIIKELDFIRDQYRNPTQHPDATYSQSEAENLYYRSILVINLILNKI